MKIVGQILVNVVVLIGLGCAGEQAMVAPPPAAEPVAVVPLRAGPVQGWVTVVNPEHQFVVVDFGEFPMPKIGTAVNVFRGDQKVGRIRLTEPSRGRLITGDVLSGELKMGDIVRP